MPRLISFSVFNLFKESIQKDIYEQLVVVSDQDDTCLIAPVLLSQKNVKVRDWQVIPSVGGLNLFHVIDHAVRERLVFFASEGRGIKQRAIYGREMHFGVLKGDRLFIWSFKERKFVELPFIPHWLVGELKSKYSSLKSLTKNERAVIGLDPGNYYCPHLYQQ